MPKHTHLHRRKGSNSYYFRAKVPVDLQEHYRKQEITYSLRTSDHKKALELVRGAAVKLDQEFAEIRRQRDAKPIQTLSKMEMDRLVLMLEHSVLSADDELRMAGSYAPNGWLKDHAVASPETAVPPLPRRSLPASPSCPVASAVGPWSFSSRCLSGAQPN
ncbi:DUF6538 domain-containing protein [Desulfobaculum xiamenense]|uniref:DUF6538 domain-containing protein n=1 Tax=Desulfobaculum xiamenense TaxID=995050 RepID=UPI00143A2EED|nr:DUF6538 domain-containing protein [Desulfobaculum xiamenense]